MEYTAEVFTSFKVTGISYILQTPQPTHEYGFSVNKNLENFNMRYSTIIKELSLYSPNQSQVVQELKNSYLAILLDESFKKNIEHFIFNGLSIHEALMAFYEHKIIQFLAPRISHEIFGLLRMLSEHSSQPFPLDKENIIIANDISLADWLRLDISLVGGIVLINSSINSHSSILARSIDLPLAIIYDHKLVPEDLKLSLITLDQESIKVTPFT